MVAGSIFRGPTDGPKVRSGVDGSQTIPGRGAPQRIMDNPDKEVESLNFRPLAPTNTEAGATDGLAKGSSKPA